MVTCIWQQEVIDHYHKYHLLGYQQLLLIYDGIIHPNMLEANYLLVISKSPLHFQASQCNISDGIILDGYIEYPIHILQSDYYFPYWEMEGVTLGILALHQCRYISMINDHYPQSLYTCKPYYHQPNPIYIIKFPMHILKDRLELAPGFHLTPIQMNPISILSFIIIRLSLFCQVIPSIFKLVFILYTFLCYLNFFFIFPCRPFFIFCYNFLFFFFYVCPTL